MKMAQIWNIVNFRWKWSKFGRLSKISKILDGDGLDLNFCWNKIQNHRILAKKTSNITIFEE